MATTLINFAPSPYAPFQFQPTLDGSVYTAIITWNLYSQRYYLDLYNLGGTHIFTIALIGSPIGTDISMTGGYFTTELVYREPSKRFEIIG
jgi:hypothetical protein